jgi:thiol reductant ABC exporter CydC subunit
VTASTPAPAPVTPVRHRSDRQEPLAPLRRTLAIARPATGRILLASLLGAGAIGASIGLIATAAWLISRAAQHPSESALGVAIVGVQFFGLSRGFFRYGERLVGHDAAFRLLADFRVRVYEHLEQLAPAGLPAFRSGDLLARIVQDVDSLQELIIRVLPPFAIAVIVGLGTVGLLWWMLPAAGLILTVALLLAATVVPWLTGALAERREQRFAAARGDLAASVLDLIEGAPELVAFGATGAQLADIHRHDAELTTIAASSAGTEGVGLALTTLLAGLASWGCLVVGIPAVASGTLDGTDLAVITLIPLAGFELVVGLPVAAQVLQRVRQAAARVFAVLDTPPPVEEPDVPAPLPGAPYDLEVRALWAGYPGAPTSALQGVDLSLPSGHRLAIVGPSGAGKSTLAAALLTFLPCRAGSARLNGTRLDRLAGDDVRTVIGLVDQEAYLFDTGIADNLRIGRRQSSDAELQAVLDRVGLSGWLADLPRGLDTAVGHHGARLSGGQRQRVGLARALLADFPVLVLDEPGEHLDPLAADALTADLLRVTEGRSVILITHRLAGLESVDEILVMDRGLVVERGSHDQLLELGGRYSSLWWEEMSTERHPGTIDAAPQSAPVAPRVPDPGKGHDDRSITS